MVIAGAGGHAREILFELGDVDPGNLFFFDDTQNAPELLLNKYEVIHSGEELKHCFKKDKLFILGVGNPFARKLLFEKMSVIGGEPYSLISRHSIVGAKNIRLGRGLNIMSGVIITTDLEIGKGTLIHIHSSVHHDCKIGEFCEISPGSKILGKVTIGNLVSVGSAAVILPGISIGDEAVIGAGAVVTKNVGYGEKVRGVPARPYL